jgi:hypothetical protein
VSKRETLVGATHFGKSVWSSLCSSAQLQVGAGRADLSGQGGRKFPGRVSTKQFRAGFWVARKVPRIQVAGQGVVPGRQAELQKLGALSAEEGHLAASVSRGGPARLPTKFLAMWVGPAREACQL